jgi:archaellum biogenesis ATPase FlaH
MSLTRVALSEMPSNSLVLVEEDSGDIKRIFAQMIVAEALAAGKRVTYISPRMKADIICEFEAYGNASLEHLDVVDKIRDPAKLGDLCNSEVCVIENLPMFFIDAVDREVVHAMNVLVHASRDGNRVILLTSDKSILPPKQEKIVRSMADGVIELTIGFNEQQINRYIHVHKLKGKPPADKLIPFSVEDSGKSIYVDTRERYA